MPSWSLRIPIEYTGGSEYCNGSQTCGRGSFSSHPVRDIDNISPLLPAGILARYCGEIHALPSGTLIITLFASLFVAYIMNPVFAVSFMQHEYEKKEHKTNIRRLLGISGIFLGIAFLFLCHRRFRNGESDDLLPFTKCSLPSFLQGCRIQISEFRLAESNFLL